MPEFRMPSINQVAFCGHLMQNPEARQTGDNRPFLTCTVAVSRPYTDNQGNWQKEITAVPVYAADKLAEYAAERLRQGTAVFVTGRLNSKGTVLEVVARQIQFLDPKEENEEPELCVSSLK